MNFKNKRLCRILCGCFACLLLAAMLPVGASAAQAYPSYTYNSRDLAVPTALPYETEAIFSSADLGLDKELLTPSDMYVTDAGEIYIMDSGNSRIVVLNSDFTLNRVIMPTNADGEELVFWDATGIFVCEDGRIVVCATKDAAVYILDGEGRQLNVIGKPESPIIPENFQFRPIKAEIDSGGIMYVLSIGSYSGALQFDKKGSFMGFYGSEDVDLTFDVLLNHFWKSIMPEAAVEEMSRSVPEEFVSFALDHKDFVFTIRKGGEAVTGQVRKLNAKGDNVLSEEKRFGDHTQDILLTDIVVDDEGFITVVDSGTGRVMQYDPDGEMLYAFAGWGTQAGTFSTPAAIESQGEKLLVLDEDRGLITVFAPTAFASSVREATLLYRDGKYKDAMGPWQKVLSYDNNYELANIGMGKIYEGLGEYQTAMDYYKKGNNKKFYSDAFEDFRADLLREYFALLMIAIVIVIMVPLVLLSKKPTVKEVYAGGRPKSKYPFYCMFHPINGYEDLKAEKSTSFWRANCILAALFVVSILAHQLTGFSYNTNRVEQLNIWVSLCSTVGVFVAFVVCNWAVTTIMDGKGKLLEIWVFCAYAMLPYVIVSAIAIVCSNVLTIDESAFYTAVQWIGIGWSAICMLIAIREVQQYTLGKTIGTLLITFFGLLVVVIVIAIVYSVFSQLIGFVSTLWSEISMRL